MEQLARFFQNQWQMKTTLPNGNELSTVQLPNRQYESCWFYANNTSEVVAVYRGREEAVAGHTQLLQQAAG